MTQRDDAIRTVDEHAFRLAGEEEDFDPLLDQIGDARVVLIGEATHGTHEFYKFRAQLTRRLIARKDFRIVAAEADWPDAYEVNRCVQQAGGAGSARDALGAFERFPLWMWRNTEVLEFTEWLRRFNAELPPEARAGFYGLDVYSLHRSIRKVIDYLETIDPEAAGRARDRYSCFDHAGDEPRRYGLAAVRGMADCEDAVVDQLIELQRNAGEYLTRDGLVARERQFVAEQNAVVARNAETYYRSMFDRDQHSWNVRDRHMAETLERLIEHYQGVQAPAKAVVWAHNSHLGDCRATDMSARGEVNLGQLVRERFGGGESVLIGQTTYDGTVSAASNWDELSSHYFKARLASQFDAVVHLDRTRALEPLDMTSPWRTGEDLPETFPTGL
ncbi:MAG: erythromycin esterase family protein [Bradymonadaceae bacterium]